MSVSLVHSLSQPPPIALDWIPPRLRAACDGSEEALRELLTFVSNRGGWRPHMIPVALQLVVRNLPLFPNLRAIHSCDSSIFEGEYRETLWLLAIQAGAAEEVVLNLGLCCRRPETIGGAPFEWFATHCSGRETKRLKRCGIECAPESKPPLPVFAIQLILCVLPATHFEAIRWQLGGLDFFRHGRHLHLCSKGRPGLLFLAQWIVCIMTRAELTEIYAHKFVINDENESWYRCRVLTLEFAQLWISAANHHPETLRAVEAAFREMIPGIFEDEAFRRALEYRTLFASCGESSKVKELVRSLDRAHGGRCPRPLQNRDFLTLVPLGPELDINPILREALDM